MGFYAIGIAITVALGGGMGWGMSKITEHNIIASLILIAVGIVVFCVCAMQINAERYTDDWGGVVALIFFTVIWMVASIIAGVVANYL